MKYRFILIIGIMILAGCSSTTTEKPHVSIPRTFSPPIADQPRYPSEDSNSVVSTTLKEDDYRELDNRVFSYDFFEDTKNNFFFLYPKGWSYKKDGEEMKFLSPELKKMLEGPNSFVNFNFRINIYKKGSKIPFITQGKLSSLITAQKNKQIESLEYKDSHAHFEEKNEFAGINNIYDYFQKQNGDIIVFEYMDNDYKTQIEEGIGYFSFTEEGPKYEDALHLFTLTYPPLWTLEKSESSEYSPNIKISPHIIISASEKRNLAMEYTPGDIYVGVVQETFDSLKKKIENLERIPNGESLTQVRDIQDITINGIRGKKAYHGTPLGIPVQFYYFPLSENSGIFMNTWERTDGKEKIIEKIISSLQIYSAPISLENFSKKYGFTLPIPSTWEIHESSPVMIGFEDVSGVHTAVIENPLEKNTPHINIRFEPLEKAPTNRNNLSDTIVVPIKTQDDIKKSAQEIKTNSKSQKIDGIPILTYFSSDPLSGDIFISAEFFYKNNLININWVLYEKMSEIPGSAEKEKIVKDKISEIEKGGGTNESKQQIKKFKEIINSLKFQ